MDSNNLRKLFSLSKVGSNLCDWSSRLCFFLSLLDDYVFIILYFWFFFSNRNIRDVCRTHWNIKMLAFAKIVTSWKPLFIFTKSSILDFWLGSEWASKDDDESMVKELLEKLFQELHDDDNDDVLELLFLLFLGSFPSLDLFPQILSMSFFIYFPSGIPLKIPDQIAASMKFIILLNHL